MKGAHVPKKHQRAVSTVSVPVSVPLNTTMAVILITLLGGVSLWAAMTLFSLPATAPDGQETPFSALVVRYLVGAVMIGVFVLPAMALARGLLARKPFAIFDETGVQILKLPMMRNHITWAHVDEIGGKGIWVVLIDKRTRRHKMLESLIGAKGLWLPTILAAGGAAPLAQAISDFRPDLFHVGPKDR